jgi:hypothetical protein
MHADKRRVLPVRAEMKPADNVPITLVAATIDKILAAVTAGIPVSIAFGTI